MQKPKILLVDDNEVFQILFRDIFWLHGIDQKFDLQVTDRIEKAELIIRDQATRPDIIFMGLVLPMEKDGKIIITPEAGFKLLDEIKGNSEWEKIKVIIFSSYNDKNYIKKAKDMGAYMYLVKEKNLPQDLVQLLDSLYAEQTTSVA